MYYLLFCIFVLRIKRNKIMQPSFHMQYSRHCNINYSKLKRKTSVEYDSFNDETFSTDAREQNSLQSMKHYFFSLIVCQDVLSHFAKCKNFTIVVFTDSFGRHPKRRLPLRLSEHLSKLSTYIQKYIYSQNLIEERDFDMNIRMAR